MTTLEEAEKARKRVKQLQKKLNDMAKEQAETQAAINKFEGGCNHNFPERVYDKKLDRFRRKCSKCGKETIERS